jgi:hypothetical protein
MAVGGLDGVKDAGMSKIESMQSSLETKMNQLMNGQEISNEELIVLQYEMGKYQTFVTTLNNTLQSIQNQTKELAKSIH